jgi:hypothetical protein
MYIKYDIKEYVFTTPTSYKFYHDTFEYSYNGTICPRSEMEIESHFGIIIHL